MSSIQPNQPGYIPTEATTAPAMSPASPSVLTPAAGGGNIEDLLKRLSEGVFRRLDQLNTNMAELNARVIKLEKSILEIERSQYSQSLDIKITDWSAISNPSFFAHATKEIGKYQFVLSLEKTKEGFGLVNLGISRIVYPIGKSLDDELLEIECEFTRRDGESNLLSWTKGRYHITVENPLGHYRIEGLKQIMFCEPKESLCTDAFTLSCVITPLNLVKSDVITLPIARRPIARRPGPAAPG